MTDAFHLIGKVLPLRVSTAALCGLALLQVMAAAKAEQPASADSAAAAEPRYLPLEKLRGFYKLMPQKSSREGVRTIANAGTTIEFGPGRRELRIGGYRCLLSYPLKDDGAGDLLISEVDIVKMIDPILRPTYIAERRLVRTVIIDPGHGGYDTGITGGFVHEADCNLLLALALREQLSKRGFAVLLTHEQNRHLSDQQRIAVAGGVDAPIFISLHLNSGRSDIQGIETYTAAPECPGATPRPANKHDAASAALAFAVHSSLVSASGAQDGGCRRAQYSLLNSIECPAIMVLAGYATHKEEGSRLNTPEYREKLVMAITEGVSAFALAINPDATLVPTPEQPAEPEVTTEPIAAPTPAPKPKADNKPKANKNKGTTKKPGRNNQRRNRKRR
ncbi:MAG: N-acetylmuramoyl-L-alanine amidase [Akkermansia sp.]|nr:N-acetylmuramoyl-L-alanine amidase [Akkermansia sp.]